MNDQKIENLLNLALDATEEEREKSLELNIGYNPNDRRWDLIVKYTGSLSRLETLEIGVTELFNGYAVLNVPESLIARLSEIEEIEYIEKPKRLFFAVEQGRRASCITAAQTNTNGLFGDGVLVGVIDSGIDYSHPDFRNEDGSTRILNLWDQSIAGGTPPQGYRIGSEYNSEQINEALNAENEAERYRIVPSRDLSGHGTHVAGIAAGNGRASNGRYKGVASQSSLIIVKLGNPLPDSFPRTTELMQSIDYVIRKALEYQQPIALNISFGNTYGSHDGSSLLETYIDSMASIWKNSICIGTGNEGAAGGHTAGTLVQGREHRIELAVVEYETAFSVQIWKSYVDEIDILIEAPSGRSAGPFQSSLGTQRFIIDGTELLLYYGEPSPYSTAQEIYIDFLPSENYVNSGLWVIELVPKRIVMGNYDLWLPSQGALNTGTRFILPTPNTTLTIPSTAGKAIAVGAYNSLIDSYADFSGRGYTRERESIKPDLAAPGVDIYSASVNGGYTSRSGTSMATPFVTGSAALLMEFGIVRGNDAYLYGEKVKAYLLKGARHLPGYTEWPNPQLGAYGNIVSS